MKSRTKWFTATAGVVALLTASGLLQATPKTVSSAPLPERVRHELVMLPYYNVFDDLSYRVDNGTVTLFGQVTDPVLKSDAEKSVKSLEGVTEVNNQIEVLPLSMSDNAIRRQAYRAIFGFSPLQRYGMGVLPSIHILVKNGHVTLSGVVSNPGDRNIAFMRANGVPGVFSVKNDLQVER